MDAEDVFANQIANLPFLEEMYRRYQAEPQPLHRSWSDFFSRFDEQPPSQLVAATKNETCRSAKIACLVEAYRRYGHLGASIDPLETTPRVPPPELDLGKWGFERSDISGRFPTLGLLPEPEAYLEMIVEALKKRYCGTVGMEFKDFLVDHRIEKWIQTRVEEGVLDEPLSREEKRRILTALTQAEMLEMFLHTKHVGKKWFSLEGAESLIPMLKELTRVAAASGVKELVIGMAHRGRLNVLANVLNKSLAAILEDFQEDYEPTPFDGMGDIHYHRGYANASLPVGTEQSIAVTLAPNPSHLESVDPVIQGQTHAIQFLGGDEQERRKIIPLLMHGDAALSGQGIVYETLQMHRLSGFQTGGTLHVVINNHIGFTTTPQEGRSTLYCTDIAHTFGFPVFHLNADDPEMCVRILRFAFELRQTFHCDVFLDLNGYRKHGHNEGDEPAYTQPCEYRLIGEKKSIRTLYLDKLLLEGAIDRETADGDERGLKRELREAYEKPCTKEKSQERGDLQEKSAPLRAVETRVSLEQLLQVAKGFSRIPPDFHLHPKVQHLILERAEAVAQNKPLDWGTAEWLAYGTLVWEGIPVRIAGQDSGRGTFSHRHALWIDIVNGNRYSPLAHLREGQGRFEAINTCLSEAAALGFEYGYSLACKTGLTIWEAQFGDFANSAQVIIDQYLASGEQKWGQISNLVVFLPHGFEGQGSDHSSARLERFLTLAGHDNLQIVNPSTPAQFFHLLRRQVKQNRSTPLIVLTPKGLLRHPSCASRREELTQKRFYLFLDDPEGPRPVRRVVLCTGRIYYDLQARREKEKNQEIAVIRLEQLYPFHGEELKKILDSYLPFHECLWVQDEPENMGAWSFLAPYLLRLLPQGVRLIYAGRTQSATPATGFYSRHKEELAMILCQVFEQ